MFSLDSLKSKITRITDILNYQMQSSESKQKGNSTRKRARQKHSECKHFVDLLLYSKLSLFLMGFSFQNLGIIISYIKKLK